MKKLLSLLAALSLLTAVNTSAKYGDIIPCRYEVERLTEPGTCGGFVVINIIWGNLELYHSYELQFSRDLKTWETLYGPFILYAGDGTFGGQQDTCSDEKAYFFRLIDADDF
jgi:hypothetical protein